MLLGLVKNGLFKSIMQSIELLPAIPAHDQDVALLLPAAANPEPV